jgi:hypothetical protein
VDLTAVKLTLDIGGSRPFPGAPIPLLPEPPAPPPVKGKGIDKWFGGRILNAQDAGNNEERAEISCEVAPIAFTGDLVLRQVKIDSKDQIIGLDSRVRLFDNEVPPPPQSPPVVETPQANPLIFNASTIPAPLGRVFFAQGTTPSAAPRDTGYQLGIDGVENDGDRVAITVAVAPLISVDSPFVVVKKPHTKPTRRVITLRSSVSSTLTGTLTKSATGPVQIFTTAGGTKPIAFDGTENVFTGPQLSSASGVLVFAESTTASGVIEDFKLTLTLNATGTLTAGSPASIKLTAVEITLDIAQPRTAPGPRPPLLSSTDKINPGRDLTVQDPGFKHERAMLIVRQPNPVVGVTLVLTSIDPTSIQAFTSETQVTGEKPIANPDTFLGFILPATGAEFFVEGKTASGALRDTGYSLGIQGLEKDADHVAITVRFSVGTHEYTGPALTIPATPETLSDLTVDDFLKVLLLVVPPLQGTTTAMSAAIRALVRYPATIDGADQPVSPALAKYPLVVIAHGRHRVKDDAGIPVESFRGLEYLARHLAGFGYIAISIDLDDLVQIAPGIKHRGLVVLQHITFWNGLNTADAIFKGKVDLGQIGLIGHSRGGEAVVSAQKANVDQGRGLKIKTVISISPTDFLGIVHSSTPYLVIYGSADNDVKLGWPFRLYDRASPFKSMVFVYGAIHNRFSASPDWLNPTLIDITTPPLPMISAEDHLNIAKSYCLAFLQLILRRVSAHIPLFKDGARADGVSAGVEFHNQVQDNPRLTVDDFEQGAFNPALAQGPQLAARATTNNLGQTVTQVGLAKPSAPVNTSALTEASLRHRELNFFWHDTFGEMLAWDAVGASYTQPLGTQDVSSFLVLSFRVTQRSGSSRNPGPSPDFSVVLKDAANRTASVRVGSIATIPVPYARTDNPVLTKSALKTIRIPLSTFASVNSSLDLHSLKQVIFEFAQTPKGEIAIDDLEFSN